MLQAEKHLYPNLQDAQYFSDKQKAKGGRGPKVSELDPEDDVFGALEPEESKPEQPAEPTMMSLEARQMFLSGQGQDGLQMWKVGHVSKTGSITLLPCIRLEASIIHLACKAEGGCTIPFHIH